MTSRRAGPRAPSAARLRYRDLRRLPYLYLTRCLAETLRLWPAVPNGTFRELQFDATRIVSAGTDCNVVVTDITSGEAVQRLRGHAWARPRMRRSPGEHVS